jgi:hypothetical protein
MWAAAKPMNCEELLLQQVEMTAAASPGTTSFVYRNAIKALPWYTLIRTKIENPAYALWFLSFGAPTVGSGWHVPACDNNYDPPLCTKLYHDQSQTPGYPHGDGDCSPPACDVGSVPVGEYLFDFRALDVAVNGQTLREWYVEEYMFGSTGLGNSFISGLYVDDDWSHGYPSEMESHAVEDMGLSPADVAAITAGYENVTAQFYARVLTSGKWIWDQFLNHDPYAPLNGDCPQPWVKKATCAADLRSLCNATAEPQSRALLYGMSPGSCTGTDPSHLTLVDEDIANFMLVRGPYAYIGTGWSGCGKVFEYPASFHTYGDMGAPAGLCAETAPGSGVFSRAYEGGTVQMDCATFTPTITLR